MANGESAVTESIYAPVIDPARRKERKSRQNRKQKNRFLFFMAAKPTPMLLDLCNPYLAHAPLPMAAVEGASHIVRYVNAAFCLLIDKSREELVGKPLAEKMPEKDKCLARLDRVYRTGKSESHTAHKHSEAHPVFSSYTMWPVIEGKRPVGVMIQVTGITPLHEKTLAMNEALILGSVRQHGLTAAADSSNALLQLEIGERKRAEKALKRAQAQLTDRAGQLEELVTERTSELTASNKRLEVSVDFVRKGKEEYRSLLLKSQIMQQKLSQLTRQMIAAQEEERKEISRELHDGVIQTLVGINVQFSALSNGATVEVHALKQGIAHTQKLVENSINEVHRFARELRPAVLDDLGLIPALRAYNKNLEERKKIKINMTAFGGVEALGIAERAVLFRVAQEALTNVVRHAHATQVEMTISKMSGAFRMEISDNGKSFPVEKTFLAKNPKRLGMIGMKERIEMVGGNLTIESTPGKGTSVRAQIPFNKSKKQKQSP